MKAITSSSTVYKDIERLGLATHILCTKKTKGNTYYIHLELNGASHSEFTTTKCHFGGEWEQRLFGTFHGLRLPSESKTIPFGYHHGWLHWYGTNVVSGLCVTPTMINLAKKGTSSIESKLLCPMRTLLNNVG